MKNKHYFAKELERASALEEIIPFSDIGTEEAVNVEDFIKQDPHFWSSTRTPEQAIIEEEEEQELREEIDKKRMELLQAVKEGQIPPDLDAYQKVLFDMYVKEHSEEIENIGREGAEASFRRFFYDNLEEILSKGITQFILKR